jgi:hypothetical protein
MFPPSLQLVELLEKFQERVFKLWLNSSTIDGRLYVLDCEFGDNLRRKVAVISMESKFRAIVILPVKFTIAQVNNGCHA